MTTRDNSCAVRRGVAFEAAVEVVTKELVADLGPLSLPDADDARDWEAWGRSQTPPRSISAADEAKTLKKLKKEEAKKGKGSTKRHPPFTSIADLDPYLLNQKQVGLVMKFLGEKIVTGMSINRCQEIIRTCLPADAALTFAYALKDASE